jgi:hypothetical protein
VIPPQTNFDFRDLSINGWKKGKRGRGVLIHFGSRLCATSPCSASLAVSVSTHITAETPRTQRLRRDLKLNHYRRGEEGKRGRGEEEKRSSLSPSFPLPPSALRLEGGIVRVDELQKF